MTRSSDGRGRWKPSGAKEVVELKAAAFCGCQPAWLTFEKREVEGDFALSMLWSECWEGSAVREELSEEKRLEPRVADENEDWMLTWSKEFRGFVDESIVE